MPEKLEIRPGGKLFATYWIYDKAAQRGVYEVRDVTKHALRLLFEKCELAPDVTLRDILLLLNSDLAVFNAVLGNHCEALVKEGLSPTTEALSELESLELYWHISAYNDQFSGYTFPAFHGVGRPNEAGERTYYAIEMTPVNQMAHIPLKLNPAFHIYEVDPDNGKDEEYHFKNAEYSLGHILHGILWELSFFGPPEKRDSFVEEVNRRVEEISKPLTVDDVISEENSDANEPPDEV